MNCPKCHKEIEIENAKYCPFCSSVLKRKIGTRQRGNGTGSAYKQDGTWTACIVIGWKVVNGVPQRIRRTKRGFQTKKAALEYISQLRGQKHDRATLDHYWQIWSNDEMQRLSESKQVAYKIAYEKLGDLVYTDIDDITIEDLKKAVSSSAKTYYTARDVRSVLKRLYELADADGVGNPRLPNYITLPKLDEKEGKPFTDEQLGKFWASYESGNTMSGYILIMIYTGMMTGQMLHLKKSCINLDDRQIVGAGLKTKARKSTPISIAEIIVPIVFDLMLESQSDRLYPHGQNKFYSDYSKLLEDLDIEYKPPYSCRHTTATALAVGENVAPQIIRKVMRWSNTKMLSRYAHPDMQDALDAVNKIGE